VSVPGDLLAALPGVDLVIWDFDGVLADTEPFHERAYRAALAHLGVNVRDDFFRDLIGRSEEDIWHVLRQRYGLPADMLGRFREERTRRYLDMVRTSLHPAPYVRPLLATTSRLSTPSVIVSAGRLFVIEGLLARWGLTGCFAEIHARPATGPAAVPKPRRLEMLAGSCPGTVLLIEDSPRYLELGRRLGMTTVAVDHSLNHIEGVPADFSLTIARPS
jgi:beta-phosphoglucomutase-like phosphatase (HAD superfamily)